MDKLFFSIVVPAHNEAKYIENTLQHLVDLDYPTDRRETIVVENGSTDITLNLAKKFERSGVKVLQSGKGVSRARNVGIHHLAPQSDWVIFLDADTILEKGFLQELNSYLSSKEKYSVGTTSLQPMPDSAYASAWFWIQNVGHMTSKTSFAIEIVRRNLFPGIRFNEQMSSGEDIQMIRDAQKHGTFFYLWTNNVLTSTRRFERVGWWRLTFIWAFGALLPKSKQQEEIDYGVVR